MAQDIAIPPGWEGFLAPEERILWQGRPDSRLDWSALKRRNHLVGLAFTVFTLILFGKAVADGAGFILIAFLFIFTLIGLQVGIGQIFWAARMRKATQYTLTDRAVFIATDLGGKRLERYELSPEMNLKLVEEGDLANLYFIDETVWLTPQGPRARGDNQPPSPAPAPRPISKRIGFERLAEARQVFALMRQAIDALPSAPAPAAQAPSEAQTEPTDKTP